MKIERSIKDLLDIDLENIIMSDLDNLQHFNHDLKNYVLVINVNLKPKNITGEETIYNVPIKFNKLEEGKVYQFMTKYEYEVINENI